MEGVGCVEIILLTAPCDFLYCAELVNKRENINSLTKISHLHKRLPVTGLENSEGFCITHRKIT